MVHPPIHFIFGDKVKNSIYNIDNVDEYWYEFKAGKQIWILQTYSLLKKHYTNISLGRQAREGCINIIHADDIGILANVEKYYFLYVRADKRSVPWSNYEIVQNKLQQNKYSHYITHWPQPGLIKRKINKKDIKNVGYFGNTDQNVLRRYSFENDLISMELNYYEMGRDNWNDYSNIDIAVGVRNFKIIDTGKNKPPSKLINAWWAEIPLISSNDSAYSQIAEPGKDYIVVTSYNELMQSIRYLIDNPKYYTMIINNGRKKRDRYSRTHVIEEWKHLLENTIFQDFDKWKKKRGFTRISNIYIRKSMRLYQRVLFKVTDSINNNLNINE
jgi:hypothetical protein